MGSSLRFLVDTDVFIDHLRGSRRLTAPRGGLAYSVVTRAELFAGSRVNEDELELLLAPFLEIVVDRAVAERAGRLRRTMGVWLPDALVAPTVYGC